jgi:hypothetical protein
MEVLGSGVVLMDRTLPHPEKSYPNVVLAWNYAKVAACTYRYRAQERNPPVTRRLAAKCLVRDALSIQAPSPA